MEVVSHKEFSDLYSLKMDNINVESVEKECGALGGLFQAIVNDMKVRGLTRRFKRMQPYILQKRDQHADAEALKPLSLKWLCANNHNAICNRLFTLDRNDRGAL